MNIEVIKAIGITASILVLTIGIIFIGINIIIKKKVIRV